jgi:HEAT repeat protein
MTNEPKPQPHRSRWPLWLLMILIAAGVTLVLDPTRTLLGRLRGEQFYEGRPSNYWAASLVSEDPVEQSKAEQAIRTGGVRAAPMLVEVLHSASGSDWSSSQCRWKSAELLGAIGPEAREHAQRALIDALDDEDPHVRKVAALAIESVGIDDPAHVPRLIEMLEGPASPAAARALSKLGPAAKDAVPALIGLLKHDVIEVRWNAARTLGKIRTPALPALPHLIEQLADPAAAVREHAAEAIGDIGPEAKEGIPALVSVLADANARVRRDAVRSLGNMGGEARATIPQIEPLLKDPESMVRDAAAQALRKIDPARDAAQ